MVGKEFNKGHAQRLFAGTPPLETLPLLLSDVAIIDYARSRTVFMINDVSRAFFAALMHMDLCIELPEEDKSEEDRRRDMFGH